MASKDSVDFISTLVLRNNATPSIVKLARKFPNVISPESLEDLNLEWRLTCEYKPSQSISDIEELIQCLNKQKHPLSNPIFPNLLKFLSTYNYFFTTRQRFCRKNIL